MSWLRSINDRRFWGAGVAVAAIAALVLALTGGGADKPSTASAATGTSSSATAAAAAVPYNGPEKKLPHTLAAPKIKKGFKYKLGYMSIYAAIPSLAAVNKGARDETKRLGGTFILKDGQLNPDKQASQINELISQHVDAIAVYPVNPAALLPGIKKARKAGIKIVMEDTPPIAGQPLIPGSSTNILQGRDTAEYSIAQGAAKADPKGKFVSLGLAIPVPLLQYGLKRGIYWAQKFGMKNLGTVNTSQDTANGAGAAMTTILAKYPDVTTVLAYNDQAAGAAASVARASGKTNVKVWGDNGEPVAIKQIQAGRVFGTYNSDFTSIGRLQAIAVYDLLTKQHLPLPKQVSVGGQAVTKANAGSVDPLGSKGPLPTLGK